MRTARASVFFLSTMACATTPPSGSRGGIPIISQRFPKGRAVGYRGEKRCGPASVAMIARGFHRKPRLTDAALIDFLDRLDDGVANRATAPGGILQMAAALNLKADVH